MRKHVGKGPFGRIPSKYAKVVCLIQMLIFDFDLVMSVSYLIQ